MTDIIYTENAQMVLQGRVDASNLDGNGKYGGTGDGTGASNGTGVAGSYTGNGAVNYAFPLEDIAQAHHFKMRIGRIPINYEHPAFGKFLPVKTATFNYVNFDNLMLSVGIYGGIPILRKKNVGRLNLTLYDNCRDEVERAIKNWIADCFPQGIYVNYLECMASKLEYYSYSVTGKLNPHNPYDFMVIPADSYNVSRSYEENNAKIINFSLIVVGEGEESLKEQPITGTTSYAVKNGSQPAGEGDILLVDIPTMDQLQNTFEMPEYSGFYPA